MNNQNNGSGFELRSYQLSLLQGIFEQWKKYRRVMAQLPTGGGKTVIFSAVAKEFVTRSERVLVLAHREELILQGAAKLTAITNQPVGIIKAGYQPDPLCPVQIASVQTLINRLHHYPEFGLVIIDEAHHSPAATYRKILEHYPKAYQLGVTATPIRSDGRGFDDLFDALVCGPTVKELIKSEHLSPFKLFAAVPMSTKGVRTLGGDYSLSGLAKANNVVKLSGQLVEAYQMHCPQKRCLIFAISVEYSKSIAERYVAAGIPAVHLDAETPDDERKNALAAFAAGEIKVISNVGLFGEGLDIPALEAVQIARPTKSLGLWLQMVGRALRPAPGKEQAILIDHTENWMRWGLPTRKRTWTLAGVEETEETLERSEDGSIIEKKEIIEEQSLLVQIQETPDFEESTHEEQWLSWYQQQLGICSSRNYMAGWIRYQLEDARAPYWLWKHHARTMGWRPNAARLLYEQQESNYF